MPTIEVSVRQKKARAPLDAYIVCGNSDYQLAVDFDGEWDAYPTKTARFVWGRTFEDMVFTGNIVPVPVLADASMCAVGFFAGDIRTTTPTYISAVRSITSSDGVPAPPRKDVYAQIMELLNTLLNGGIGGSGPPGTLLYVDESGKYAFLTLGPGLAIVDGVLTLDGTEKPDEPENPDTTIAVLGVATLGTMVLGNGG